MQSSILLLLYIYIYTSLDESECVCFAQLPEFEIHAATICTREVHGSKNQSNMPQHAMIAPRIISAVRLYAVWSIYVYVACFKWISRCSPWAAMAHLQEIGNIALTMRGWTRKESYVCAVKQCWCSNAQSIKMVHMLVRIIGLISVISDER